MTDAERLQFAWIRTKVGSAPAKVVVVRGTDLGLWREAIDGKRSANPWQVLRISSEADRAGPREGDSHERR